MKLIKSTKHTTKFSNVEKLNNLHTFIDEYRRVITLIVDSVWNKGYKWQYNGELQVFSIQDNLLLCPPYFDYKLFNIETNLTARALSSIVTQATALIKAEVTKQKKRLYMLDVLKNGTDKKEKVSRKKRKALIKSIKTNIPVKPNCELINPELSSKCLDWEDVEGEFDGVLRIKSIFKNKTEIKIPIKHHKHSNKMINDGREMLNSFLIKKNNIDIRWQKEVTLVETGEVVGCDQGFKDIASLSDKQTTIKEDIHGHSLESILGKMSKKRKGSKAFSRSQYHRDNFIKWNINQLNFGNIKELRLEEIKNIGYKSKTCRIMSHWTNTTIRDKITQKCEDEGIRLIHQSSTYRSQRCSSCGIVRKANRKRKDYKCKHCGLEIDADYNASLNHLGDLPDVPYSLRMQKLNRGNGFYWRKNGFFMFSEGSSLESEPLVEVK